LETFFASPDLRGGDVFAWLRPKNLDSHNIGHEMFKPSPNPSLDIGKYYILYGVVKTTR
jgi:hypothetical protein